MISYIKDQFSKKSIVNIIIHANLSKNFTKTSHRLYISILSLIVRMEEGAKDDAFFSLH